MLLYHSNIQSIQEAICYETKRFTNLMEQERLF